MARIKIKHAELEKFTESEKSTWLKFGLKSALMIGCFVIAILLIVAVTAATTGIILLTGNHLIAIIAVAVIGILGVFAIVFWRNLEA